MAWLVYECYISYLDLFDARATICQYLLGITKNTPRTKNMFHSEGKGLIKDQLTLFVRKNCFRGRIFQQFTSPNRATIELPPGVWVLHQCARLDPIVLRSKSGAFQSTVPPKWWVSKLQKKSTMILLKGIEKQQMFVDTEKRLVFNNWNCNFSGLSSVDFPLFKWYHSNAEPGSKKTWFHLPKFSRFAGIFF